MAFTPDPETSWAHGFAGALANPGITIDLSSFTGKFAYSAAVFEYYGTIGVKRYFDINPVSLLGLIGPNKFLSRIAPFLGNYVVQVSEFTNITLGNILNLERSRISYNTNREYPTWVKVVVSGILILMALTDIAVVYTIGYGLKDNDSGAKKMVGFQLAIHSSALIVLHVLEAFGVEALDLLKGLVIELTQIIERLNHFISKNGNPVDILNPLLTTARVTALKVIAEKSVLTAKNAIGINVTAVGTVVQANPAPPCWVARAVYGPDNPRWILFRQWLFGNGPVPEVRTLLQKLYLRYGQSFAMVVDKSPCLRSVLRLLMDLALYTHQKKAVGVGHAK